MASIQVELLSICDFALTSKEGKLSIIGMFDRIFVTATPSRYSRLFLVAIITGNPNSTHSITIEISTQANKPLLPPREVTITFAANGKANLITDIVNLPLPEIGEYFTRLRSGTTILASQSLFVTKVNTKNQLKD